MEKLETILDSIEPILKIFGSLVIFVLAVVGATVLTRMPVCVP